MSDGTKSFFTSTKNIFSSKKGKSSQNSGVTSHYSTRNKQPEPGFFEKLFYTEPRSSAQDGRRVDVARASASVANACRVDVSKNSD